MEVSRNQPLACQCPQGECSKNKETAMKRSVLICSTGLLACALSTGMGQAGFEGTLNTYFGANTGNSNTGS